MPLSSTGGCPLKPASGSRALNRRIRLNELKSFEQRTTRIELCNIIAPSNPKIAGRHNGFFQCLAARQAAVRGKPARRPHRLR
jgi:hypothetical protein